MAPTSSLDQPLKAEPVALSSFPHPASPPSLEVQTLGTKPEQKLEPGMLGMGGTKLRVWRGEVRSESQQMKSSGQKVSPPAPTFLLRPPSLYCMDLDSGLMLPDSPRSLVQASRVLG